MKYKLLKSIAHNFTHSFVSYTNYFDCGYVIEDLRQLAREANGERIRIQWIPDIKSDSKLTPRILNSINYYKTWLPKFVHESGGEIGAIQEFRTEIYIKPSKQIAVEAYLLDNRGKEHVANVIF